MSAAKIGRRLGAYRYALDALSGANSDGKTAHVFDASKTESHAHRVTKTDINEITRHEVR